jgi:hypothetical protein
MPKTNSGTKPVRSFRLSAEGVNQLKSMATVMGRSESDVLEVALDRMYREEIRYNRVLRDGDPIKDQYMIRSLSEEKDDDIRDGNKNNQDIG